MNLNLFEYGETSFGLKVRSGEKIGGKYVREIDHKSNQAVTNSEP
jgi:hypothetical protein